MSRTRQTDRLRRMLEVAGPSGVTQLDMMRPLDGGPPIMALSQRAGDLRRAGVPIRTDRVRAPGGSTVCRYILAPQRRVDVADQGADADPERRA